MGNPKPDSDFIKNMMKAMVGEEEFRRIMEKDAHRRQQIEEEEKGILAGIMAESGEINSAAWLQSHPDASEEVKRRAMRNGIIYELQRAKNLIRKPFVNVYTGYSAYNILTQELDYELEKVRMAGIDVTDIEERIKTERPQLLPKACIADITYVLEDNEKEVNDGKRPYMVESHIAFLKKHFELAISLGVDVSDFENRLATMETKLSVL